MKVNLIKDSSVSKELFTEVFDILNSVPGPIKFSCDHDSLATFNDYEIYNGEELGIKEFETKKSNETNMLDVILEAQKLLYRYDDTRIDGIRLDIEIELKCPFCDDNVFIVNLPLGEYPRGECKRSQGMEIIRDRFSIKKYIELKNFFTWEEFLDKVNKFKETKKYKDEIKALELEQTKKNLKITNWEILFDKCNNYRKESNLNKEDFVILLSEINNTKNWFSCLDEKNPFNGFIHTKDWDYYINCGAVFPIAYEVIALVIQKYIFNNFHEIENNSHSTPIGCINDRCIQKRDIILKLRTADICPECMNILKQKLSFSIIKNALEILEFLRTKMLFSQKFTGLSPLSRLIVDKRKKMYLPDFDNIKIELDALHMTVYMLYLFHPEGIEMSSLCDFKNEMYHIYSHIGKRSDILEMKKSIDSIADITSNSASEKIGKIKKTFINAIGGELAKNYYIKGANGKVKKIDIDRKLVQVAD